MAPLVLEHPGARPTEKDRYATCGHQEAEVTSSVVYNLGSGFSENARPETIRKLSGVLRVKPQTFVAVRRIE